MREFKEIDGSKGEGGGQILRTSLSLSACTGQPVRIQHIRRGRKKPGLMRQHLTCVNAVAKICNAKVKGATIGSKNVEFIPNEIAAGEYHFSMGGAGSTTLVFQTVLPALLLAQKPSRLIFEGGTHNPRAPNYDFLCNAFLPVLAKMGLVYTTSIAQYGFYPVGGGRFSIEITPPQQFSRIEIEQRGELIGITARCLGSGVPAHVMQREKRVLLSRAGWHKDTVSTENVRALGAGNVVIIKAEYDYVSDVVDSIGAKGIHAERVAVDALDKLRKYQGTGAPVGEHLADQLLLPLAVASGGTYITGKLSEHTKTNIEVIKQLTDVKIAVQPTDRKHQFRICVTK